MPAARAILENWPETDQTSEGLRFLRFWIRRLSSVLAIAGGALFLVLPVAFSQGIVSVVYPPLQWRCPPGIRCLLFPYPPSPAGVVPFWISLGVVGILLGILTLKLSLRPRVGVALGLVFSLGSMALLFWIITLQILETFITTPASFLLFPELSVVAMTGATLLFSYELARRGRELIEAITS